ncbi:MAG: hypothetical protein NTX15_04305, partial [Candidatus Kapabacteria bacterium]|nr:hypothetical protein [Candidatus Kapabacteria bacterium]
LPVTDTFKIAAASISDAVFIVTADGTDIEMVFSPDSLGGTYRARDTSYRVKPGVTYFAEVRARGYVLKASTKTPPVFTWIKPPADTLNYPGVDNETLRYDSLDVFWSAVPGVFQYIISSECLDTIGYGKYVDGNVADTNRRIREKDRFDDGTLITSERTRYGFALQPSTPVVWSAYKWFGKHEIRVYAPDKAFLDWFRLVGFGRRSQYDYRNSNVTGGLGVWGSASIVKSNNFLKKDQP